jgi:hypothetical protein
MPTPSTLYDYNAESHIKSPTTLSSFQRQLPQEQQQQQSTVVDTPARLFTNIHIPSAQSPLAL